uniref:Uncharacterized protein n=1 Tax=Lepeophtheirus salmonis TaxID=72036 RepID=A0A0K2V8G1_LEPSM
MKIKLFFFFEIHSFPVIRRSSGNVVFSWPDELKTFLYLQIS